MSDLNLEDAPLESAATEAAGCETAPPTHELLWQSPSDSIAGVRVGVLVGVKDDGRTPLVIYPGQRGSAAVPARATIDLHGSHVGREVVLMFEDGDPRLPIVLGCMMPRDGSPTSTGPGQVELEGDGERLQVTATDQLVLRCGKASITLTKAGKVLIQGAYVSSRSSGVNRIKGGSVQVN